jgi:hypothetical protein
VSARALAGAAESYIRRGWRVESALTPGQVVMVHGKRPNHVLHLLLSVFTLGLWLPVWLILAVSTKEQRTVLTAQSDGSVTNSLAADAAQAAPWYQRTSTIVALSVLGILALAKLLG